MSLILFPFILSWICLIVDHSIESTQNARTVCTSSLILSLEFTEHYREFKIVCNRYLNLREHERRDCKYFYHTNICINISNSRFLHTLQYRFQISSNNNCIICNIIKVVYEFTTPLFSTVFRGGVS
jgi:hypothetical protein